MSKTVRISADTWRKVSRALAINDGAATTVPTRTAGTTMIRIRNSSGVNVNRFAVLGIADSMIDAASDAFQQSVVLDGVTPSEIDHAGGKFVICAEPILNGSVGRAYAAGVTVAQVTVSDAAHGFADIDNGQYDLKSADEGTCAILWKQSGTGSKAAVLRFGGGGGGGEAAAMEWAIVTAIPDYNEPSDNRFTVKKASINGGAWEGTGDDIHIERALGFEGYLSEGDDFPKDIRNWSPWPNVGAIVPIIQKFDAEQTTPAERWYFDIDMIYGGPEGISSIRYNPGYLDPMDFQSRHITQAVWV